MEGNSKPLLLFPFAIAIFIKKGKMSDVHTLDEIKTRLQSHFAHGIEPSNEQTVICHALQTHNCVIDSIAGSGKTTTATAIAATFPKANILLLTYNTRLKNETQKRFQDYTNVTVNNYHSYVVKIYQHPCKDDREMNRFLDMSTSLRESKALMQQIPLYDLIILDEIQDMTPLLFRLVSRIVDDMKFHSEFKALPRFAILGDVRQSIYEFMDSDARFLTLAPIAFASLSAHPWRTDLKLSMSYRLTNPMANMINECYLGGEQRLHACRQGPQPIYLWVEFEEFTRSDSNTMKVLVALINKHGPGNTFVLAPSVKNQRHPIRILENILSTQFHIPTYVTGDDREIHDRACRNKLVFSTQCSSKGLERDLVINMGCDDAPYNKYSSLWSADNRLYVAMTRAKAQLVLIHAFQAPRFRYTPRDAIIQHCEVITTCINERNWLRRQTGPPRTTMEEAKRFPTRMTVTDLIRFQPMLLIDDLLSQMCEIEERQPALLKEENALVNIASVASTTQGACEEISDITGKLFQHVVEYALLGTSISLGSSEQYKQRPHISQLAKLAIKNDAFAESGYGATGYKGRYLQMPQNAYHWITEDHISIAHKRFQTAFGGSLDAQSHPYIQTEVDVVGIIDDLIHPADEQNEMESLRSLPTYTLGGTVDFMEREAPQIQTGTSEDAIHLDEDNDGDDKVPETTTIWEVKFTESITPEYIMQLLLYGYMVWKDQSVTVPRMIIYNVKTDQLLQIHPKVSSWQEWNPMIQRLIHHKYASQAEKLDDTKFLSSIQNL